MNRLRLITPCFAWMVLPLILFAQPHTWTGQEAAMNAQHNQFHQVGNWLGGVAPEGASQQVFVFGEAKFYQPAVDSSQGRYYRVLSLTFSEDAGAYRITGEPLIYGDESFVVNRSRFRQEIANPIRFSSTEKVSGIRYLVNTGKAGILWSGGSSKENIDRVQVDKLGESSLELKGVYDTIHVLSILQGDLVMDGETKVSFPFQGGVLRVLGKNADATEISPFGAFHLNSDQAAKIILEPELGKPLTLVVDQWLGHYGMLAGSPQYYLTTLHFDLSAPSSHVRFRADGVGGALAGAGGIVPFATVTDETGVTGFVRLVRETPEGMWTVYRAQPQHELPKTVDEWSANRHYHVTLTKETPVHRLVSQIPRGAGVVMAAEWPTLTLRGAGNLVLENHYLRAPYILLEEGEGDFVISGPGIANHGGGYFHTTYAMRIFTYRNPEAGALIINTDHFGHVKEDGSVSPEGVNLFDITQATLAKTGPGTLIFRSPSSNIIGGLYVQEGRIQVDSTGFKVTSLVKVFQGGTLAGSGEIGGGDRWVKPSSAPSKEGIRYTPVRISYSGVIDVTPIRLDKRSESKALSIWGSLFMERDASLLMTLSQNVVSGSYTPMQVLADRPKRDAAVILNGNLQLDQLENISTETEVVLLKTNSYISGLFQTINGEPIDTQDQAIVRHNDASYTVFVDYSRDLGNEQTGLVVRITPRG